MAIKQLMFPANRAFTTNGVPIAGATATLYVHSTSTPAIFYSDAALLVPLGSTITANAIGKFPTAYQTDATPFRIVIKDTTGATLDDIDPFYFGTPTDYSASASAAAASATAAASSASSSSTSATASSDSATAAAASQALLQPTADAALLAATTALQLAATTATNLLATASPSALLLFAGESDGFALQAGGTSEVYVKDASDITKAFNGRFEDWAPVTVFPKEILCTQSDGTLKFSDHNLLTIPSNDFTDSGWTKTTLTATAADATGFQLITSTSTAASVKTAITACIQNRWYGWQFTTRADTNTDYMSFSAFSTTVYLNTTTGAVATNGGFTAQSYTTDELGVALPVGDYRWVLSIKASAATVTAQWNIVNADGSATTSASKFKKIRSVTWFRGVKAPRYLVTTSAARYAAPVDWTNGSAEFYLAPSVVARSLWGDDLTQAGTWTATNITPALSSTGPHGQPCSLLTASAGNGTIFQAITLTALARMSSVYIRRKIGTGTVSITVDGGSTYTDITSSLNVNTYTRVSLAASAANPSIGLKISTSGDAVEVSLFHITDGVSLYTPIPTYAVSAVSTTASAFTLPNTLYTFAGGNPVHIYGQFSFSAAYGATPPIFTFGNVAATTYQKLSLQTVGTWAAIATDSVNSNNNTCYTHVAGEIGTEFTLRPKANENAISINGSPIFVQQKANAITQEQLVFAPGNGPIWLRKLVVSKRSDIALSDLYKWRWSRRTGDRGMIASSVVALDSDTAGTTMNRETNLIVLSDTGNRAQIAYFWQQRHSPGYGTETPMRLMQRNYELRRNDDGTVDIVALTSAQAIAQQAGWASDTGHIQGSACYRVDRNTASGAPKGRIGVFTTQLDPSSSTNIASGTRNLYHMYNDYNGDPTRWSTPVKVVDVATQLSGVSAYAIASNNNPVTLPSDHATAPNRTVLALVIDSKMIPLYSDNFGGTAGTSWTLGTAFTNPVGETTNEVNLALWGDGTIIATHRLLTGDKTRRCWSKSTDGITFTSQGFLPSWVGSDCNASMLRIADDSGSEGRFGRLAMARPVVVTGNTRAGCRMDCYADDGMAYSAPWYALDPARYYGYTSISRVFGDMIAMAVEGSNETTGFNIRNNAYLVVLRPPWAGFGGSDQTKRLTIS